MRIFVDINIFLGYGLVAFATNRHRVFLEQRLQLLKIANNIEIVKTAVENKSVTKAQTVENSLVEIHNKLKAEVLDIAL